MNGITQRISLSLRARVEEIRAVDLVVCGDLVIQPGDDVVLPGPGRLGCVEGLNSDSPWIGVGRASGSCRPKRQIWHNSRPAAARAPALGTLMVVETGWLWRIPS